MTIGEKVKQAREAKNMTQEELARALGYKSRTSINKIETGERDVPRRQIRKIAQILGVPAISLLGLDDDIQPYKMPTVFKTKNGTTVVKIPEKEKAPLNGIPPRSDIYKIIDSLTEDEYEELKMFIDNLKSRRSQSDKD